jgi:hypothetical protein
MSIGNAEYERPDNGLIGQSRYVLGNRTFPQNKAIHDRSYTRHGLSNVYDQSRAFTSRKTVVLKKESQKVFGKT